MRMAPKKGERRFFLNVDGKEIVCIASMDNLMYYRVPCYSARLYFKEVHGKNILKVVKTKKKVEDLGFDDILSAWLQKGRRPPKPKKEYVQPTLADMFDFKRKKRK